MGRRVELELTVEEVWVVERGGRAPRELCGVCGAAMVTAEEAAALAGASVRELCRLVEAGALHFAEPPGGHLLVCLATLLPPALPARGGR